MIFAGGIRLQQNGSVVGATGVGGGGGDQDQADRHRRRLSVLELSTCLQQVAHEKALIASE